MVGFTAVVSTISRKKNDSIQILDEIELLETKFIKYFLNEEDDL